MILEYDTGEVNHILLSGFAEDANIKLEKHSVELPDTYITQSSAQTVRIYNRSDIMAKFNWKRFSTLVEENSFRNSKLLAQSAEDEKEKREFLEVMCLILGTSAH